MKASRRCGSTSRTWRPVGRARGRRRTRSARVRAAFDEATGAHGAAAGRCSPAASATVVGWRRWPPAEGMPAAGLVFLGYPLQPPEVPTSCATSTCTTSRCRCCSSRARRTLRGSRHARARPRQARRPSMYVPFEGGGPLVRAVPEGRRERGRGLARSRRSASFMRGPYVMPRRNRRGPECPCRVARAPLVRQKRPPGRKANDDVEVRKVSGDKAYRCPGCDHPVRAGLRHLVVVPTEDADARRHWHTKLAASSAASAPSRLWRRLYRIAD